MAWWTDRHGKTHTYWHGNGNMSSLINPNLSVCKCHFNNSTDVCQTCQCDTDNNRIWLEDEGELNSKEHLPVTQLNFGGMEGRLGKMARFELGPLECSGQANVAKSRLAPENCADLWQNGHTNVGYYMVKSGKRSYPKVIFCDMRKEVDVVGFERVYGSPGNLRYFAAFDVVLDRPFYDDFRYLNFTSALVNTENFFDLQDGIFRVPYSGTYMFSVHALPMKNRPFKVQIHRNGIAVAILSNGKHGKSMVGQSILLDAAAGDEIRLFNFGGDIYGDARMSESFFHFIGLLLHSSDRE